MLRRLTRAGRPVGRSLQRRSVGYLLGLEWERTVPERVSAGTVRDSRVFRAPFDRVPFAHLEESEASPAGAPEDNAFSALGATALRSGAGAAGGAGADRSSSSSVTRLRPLPEGSALPVELALALVAECRQKPGALEALLDVVGQHGGSFEGNLHLCGAVLGELSRLSVPASALQDPRTAALLRFADRALQQELVHQRTAADPSSAKNVAFQDLARVVAGVARLAGRHQRRLPPALERIVRSTQSLVCERAARAGAGRSEDLAALVASLRSLQALSPPVTHALLVAAEARLSESSVAQLLLFLDTASEAGVLSEFPSLSTTVADRVRGDQAVLARLSLDSLARLALVLAKDCEPQERVLPTGTDASAGVLSVAVPVPASFPAGPRIPRVIGLMPSTPERRGRLSLTPASSSTPRSAPSTSISANEGSSSTPSTLSTLSGPVVELAVRAFLDRTGALRRTPLELAIPLSRMLARLDVSGASEWRSQMRERLVWEVLRGDADLVGAGGRAADDDALVVECAAECIALSVADVRSMDTDSAVWKDPRAANTVRSWAHRRGLAFVHLGNRLEPRLASMRAPVLAAWLRVVCGSDPLYRATRAAAELAVEGRGGHADAPALEASVRVAHGPAHTVTFTISPEEAAVREVLRRLVLLRFRIRTRFESVAAESTVVAASRQDRDAAVSGATLPESSLDAEVRDAIMLLSSALESPGVEESRRDRMVRAVAELIDTVIEAPRGIRLWTSASEAQWVVAAMQWVAGPSPTLTSTAITQLRRWSRRLQQLHDMERSSAPPTRAGTVEAREWDWLPASALHRLHTVAIAIALQPPLGFVGARAPAGEEAEVRALAQTVAGGGDGEGDDEDCEDGNEGTNGDASRATHPPRAALQAHASFLLSLIPSALLVRVARAGPSDTGAGPRLPAALLFRARNRLRAFWKALPSATEREAFGSHFLAPNPIAAAYGGLLRRAHGSSRHPATSPWDASELERDGERERGRASSEAHSTPRATDAAAPSKARGLARSCVALPLTSEEFDDVYTRRGSPTLPDSMRSLQSALGSVLGGAEKVHAVALVDHALLVDVAIPSLGVVVHLLPSDGLRDTVTTMQRSKDPWAVLDDLDGSFPEEWADGDVALHVARRRPPSSQFRERVLLALGWRSCWIWEAEWRAPELASASARQDWLREKLAGI